jgi:hypothetical protein
MPRVSPNQSIADAINESVQSMVARVLPSLQRAFNAAVEARVRAALPGRKKRVRGRAARPPPGITSWVADNRARRVPNFVIEATGLDTKKRIVAKYGQNAAFSKGKPLPPVKLDHPKPGDAQPKAGRVVKAKPPVVRKAAAASK